MTGGPQTPGDVADLDQVVIGPGCRSMTLPRGPMSVPDHQPPDKPARTTTKACESSRRPRPRWRSRRWSCCDDAGRRSKAARSGGTGDRDPGAETDRAAARAGERRCPLARRETRYMAMKTIKRPTPVHKRRSKAYAQPGAVWKRNLRTSRRCPGHRAIPAGSRGGSCDDQTKTRSGALGAGEPKGKVDRGSEVTFRIGKQDTGNICLAVVVR